MALKVGELFALLSLNNTQFNAGLAKAKGDMHAFSKDTESSLTEVALDWRQMAAVAVAALVAIATAQAAAGSAMAFMGIKAAAAREDVLISFETMLKSAERANQFLAELRELNKKTPFDLPQLADAARALNSYGYSTSQIKDMLIDLGDAASASGKGAEGLETLIRAIGKMKGSGKVDAEAMNMIADLGLGPWKMLATQMGITEAEVHKLSESGKLLAVEVIPKLLAAMQADFGGNMEKAADKWNGAVSNLQDALGEMFVDIGDGFIKELQPFVKWLTDEIPRIYANLQPNIEVLMDSISSLLDVIVDNMPEITILFEVFVNSISAGVDVLAKMVEMVGWLVDNTPWLNPWNTNGEGLRIAYEHGYAAVTLAQKAQEQAALAAQSQMAAAAEEASRMAQEQQEAAVRSAEQQTKSVSAVLLKQKELHEEENSRRRDAIGFISFEDVWKKAMVAGLQSGIPKAEKDISLNASDIPSGPELKKIADEIKKQTEIQVQTQAVIRDRLALYGV